MYTEQDDSLFEHGIEKSVNIPVELYESWKGNYFIGYADNLTLGKGKSAWARLYNPQNSGVNLFVNVWTVTELSSQPFRAQFWFNASPPPGPFTEALVTPTNTALRPRPKPNVRLQQASDVKGMPSGGIKAFVRRGEAGTTVVETENGKLIFPPGGNFLVFLSLEGDADVSGEGRIAFGWWEEPVCRCV
jgi:hypothetical protein